MLAPVRLRVHDPHRVALRRAARTALLMPPLFAFALFVLNDEAAALFAAFGVIGMFAFADFGGPLRRRAGAYVGLTIVGAALISLGTVLSGRAYVGALVMAGVAFVVTFAGAAGGYVAHGGAAAILAFVLSIAVPAPDADIPSRLLGWGMAGAAAAVAAVALWPVQVRSRLRQLAAELAVAVADLVDALADPHVLVVRGTDRAARARDAAAALLDAYFHLPYRPSGPAARDQSLVYLMTELRRGSEFACELTAVPGLAERVSGADRTLLASTAATLRATAESLRGATPPDLARLEEARRRQADTLESSIGDVGEAQARELVHRAVDIRIVSYIAVSAAVNAALCVGRRVRDPGFEFQPLAPEPGLDPTLSRLVGLARSNLRWDSVWLQAAIRAAIGLGLAVFVALVARLDHAFWVVLGTMTALKSSAITTAYTAWQALLGTVAGFAISSAVLLASGEDHPALWAALPVSVFLAVYTPTAVHAIAGQAMFTVAVVVLFNIIEPEGWRTGLVRIEDILIGCGASILIGSLLWPRGARAQLRETLEALLVTGGTSVREALRQALGRTNEADADQAATAVRESGLRAVDAFATYLNERGPKQPPMETWVRLLGGGYQLRFVGDAILVWARGRASIGATDAEANRLEADARRIEEDFERAGHALVAGAGSTGSSEVSRAPRPKTGEGVAPTYGVLFLEEWIAHTGTILDRLREPIHDAAATGGRPWWR